VSSTSQNLSDIKAEFAYVGTAFAADAEKRVPPFNLQQIQRVNPPRTQLTFDGRPQGRSLINLILKLAQDLLKPRFRHVTVKLHDTNVLFPTVEQRLNNFRTLS
jgi:hypothetical protein